MLLLDCRPPFLATLISVSCRPKKVGYDDELRSAMLYVFGSSIVCDSLQIAKEVKAPEISAEVSLCITRNSSSLYSDTETCPLGDFARGNCALAASPMRSSNMSNPKVLD